MIAIAWGAVFVFGGGVVFFCLHGLWTTLRDERRRGERERGEIMSPTYWGKKRRDP